MTLQEQKEQKAVDYLRRQIDFGNPEVVLRVYKQVLTQGLFETQVGLGFFLVFRDFLLRSPEISPADVPVLAGAEPDAEVYAARGDASATEGEDAAKAEEDRQALEQAATREAIRREAQRIVRRERALSREYRNKMYKALVGVVICVIAMIAMLVITLTSNLPTIINYRTKIVDEYSTWEKELNEREEALREYEESLDQRSHETGSESISDEPVQEIEVNDDDLAPIDESLFEQ